MFPKSWQTVKTFAMWVTAYRSKRIQKEIWSENPNLPSCRSCRVPDPCRDSSQATHLGQKSFGLCSFGQASPNRKRNTQNVPRSRSRKYTRKKTGKNQTFRRISRLPAFYHNPFCPWDHPLPHRRCDGWQSRSRCCCCRCCTWRLERMSLLQNNRPKWTFRKSFCYVMLIVTIELIDVFDHGQMNVLSGCWTRGCWISCTHLAKIRLSARRILARRPACAQGFWKSHDLDPLVQWWFVIVWGYLVQWRMFMIEILFSCTAYEGAPIKRQKKLHTTPQANTPSLPLLIL